MSHATGELTWVGDVLWGRSNWVSGAAAANGEGRREIERFGVLPSAERPRLLVPLGSRRAARRALLSYTSSKATVRAGTQVLALAAAAGLAPRLVSDQVVVTDASRSEAGSLSVPLQEHLKRVLGRTDLHVAVMFQTGRPQKKPVLQLIAGDGSVVGFAKVGWNDLTRSLVRSEAAALQDLARLPRPRHFAVGAVLFAGAWQDLELLVVEARTRAGLRRRRLLTELPVAATGELARIEPTSTLVLTQTGWWKRTLADAHAVAGRLDRPLRVNLERLAAFAAAAGDARVEVGWSHGDWVPWNMDATGGTLSVWDWERAVRHAPVGLDAVQFLFQTELNLRRCSPEAAVGRVLAASEPALEPIGAPASAMPLLLGLHLLQTVVRLEQGRDRGVGGVIPADRYDRAIAALLSRCGKDP